MIGFQDATTPTTVPSVGIFTRRRVTAQAQAQPPAPFRAGLDVASPWANRDHFETILWSELLGDTSELSDAPMPRTEAMSIAAFARARNVLCSTAGRLPLEVYQGARLVTDRTCVNQPEPGRPRFITVLWTVDQMMCHGRAWWIVTSRYADGGKPRTFEWVPEWAGIYDEDGNLTGDTKGRTFRPGDVVRIDGPHEGVLNYAGRVLRQSQRLARAALRSADNPVPSIDLHQTTPDPLSPKEKRELVDGWAAARRGANGGVAYTNAAIEAKVLGQPVEQLLIEGRRAADLEVARAVGVPAWALDIGVEGSSITYSNVASRSRELVDYGLMPYLAALEGRLSMDDVLPAGTWCRFNLDELLRGDFGDRMTAYKTATDAGIYTPEELRARETGTPLEQEEA